GGGDLDNAGGGVGGGVGRQERDGAVEQRAAGAAGDSDLRREAVPGQIHLGAAGERVVGGDEGMVLPDVTALRRCGRRRLPGDVRVVAGGLAGRQVSGAEVVEVHRERRQRSGLYGPAGLERVVGDGGVGESLPVHDDHIGLVAVECAPRHPAEQQQQADVEEQV